MEKETENYLNKLHPAKQLDKVLKCLYPDTPPIHKALEIVETLKLNRILTKESEVIFILEKLMIDGFATKEVRSEKVTKSFSSVEESIISSGFTYKVETVYYLITFNGRVRIEYEGGYQGMLSQKMEIENQLKISQAQEKQNQIDFQAYQKDNEDKMVTINSRMVTLTMLLVFGTLIAAVYYFDQICKEHHWLWH